jgi:hypothetical protein
LSRNLDKNVFIAKKPSISQGLPLKKKGFLTIAFISVLPLSVLAGTQLVNLGRANFMPFPSTPSTDPPIVIIQSPENHTYLNSSNLNFTLIKPDSWRLDWVAGNIKSILYSLNNQLNFIEVGRRKINTGGEIYSIDNLTKTSQHSINLTGLGDGQHLIELNVTAVTFYNPPEDYWTVHEYEMFVSKKIVITTKMSSGNMSFTMDAIFEKVFPDKIPPVISILSVENKTYDTCDVPLNCTVNESVTQITFSLDGQENLTIPVGQVPYNFDGWENLITTGKTTLTNLTDGEHSLTVYATDEAGNTGASETIYFRVEVPEPFPTTLIIAASAASATVIAVGLMVYFKKRKR